MKQSHQNTHFFANEWQRVRVQERGKLHELTAALVKQSITFYFESLNIFDLIKSCKLSRSMLESNRGTLLKMVTCKAESAGGKVGKVDPQDMSQLCSCCGSKADKKLTLSVRTCRSEISDLKITGLY